MKKAVLVTGASSGIGAATAKLFANQGYFVYLLGRNEERLQEVALSCPGGASLLKCDLNNEAQLDKYTKHLFERADTQLEVLVNNAGVFEQHTSQKDEGLDIWRKMFETNFFGSINLTQRVLPLLARHHQGSIVNVSSTLGLRPTAQTAAYSASKAAMINWTQSLALELGPQKIRVNCVCPGLVDTPIHAFHSLNSKAKEAALDNMKNLQPLGRIGHPEEIAQSIYFLGSQQSSWTTGAILSVDGGINLT
ncbi:MAG: NAD(P)-dependent oxidoreductase [Bdellovibrio sp. CG10_big_fil_rev_8_21_14_0_10_47_8]|nr:MAG: NAD(P)-dependent oxidoreductase [Bdellovibrio sp. CG10_big_fil_rev_8_21_14_0_10_47_8]